MSDITDRRHLAMRYLSSLGIEGIEGHVVLGLEQVFTAPILADTWVYQEYGRDKP